MRLKDSSSLEKAIFAGHLFCLIGVLSLMALELFTEINVPTMLLPLICSVNMLLAALGGWKQSKKLAIANLCMGIIILAGSVVIIIFA